MERRRLKDMEQKLTTRVSTVPRLVQNDAVDLAKLGRRQHVAKSSYVFQVGDLASQVYLLESGQAKVYRASAHGTQVLLFFHGQNEIIGIHETMLGDGTRLRSYAAQASEESVVCAVPRDRFLAFIAARFRVAQYVVEALCFRLDETNEKLASFAAADMGARVARVILHMSACYGQHVGGEAVELGVPLTQQELANVIGAARQTVNGIIQSLKADGIITVTKQHMRVENEVRLRRIAMRDVGNDEY